MGDFKISGKNVITQAGTAEPVLASNVTLGTGIVKSANIQDAATSTLSCTTNSTTTVTTADTSTLSVGMAVSGTGIPAGATIVTVPNSTSFTLSAAATASATNTLTFQKGIVASKIEDDAVTYAKLQNLGTANRVLGSSSTGVIGEVQIAEGMIATDAVTATKIAATSITEAKLHADVTDGSAIQTSVKPHIQPGTLYPAWSGLLEDNTGHIFTDSSSSARTVTPLGNVQHMGKVSKVGSTSIAFEADADRMEVTDHADFDNGTAGEFTLEFWAYINELDATANYFFNFGDSILRLSWDTNNSYWYFNAAGNASTSYTTAPTIKTWMHIAIVGTSSTVKVYIDGTERISVARHGSTALNPAVIRIGAYSNGSYSLLGYLDEIRYVVGEAVYTGTFTPPTALTTSGGTYSSATNVTNPSASQTKFLIHSDNGGNVGAYGTAQADGRKYYYTDIKGSKPIKDPRIGTLFGSQRYKFRSLQILEQETVQNGKNTWSIDGREWMKATYRTADAYVENNEKGTSIRGDAEIEIVGYFNSANISGFTHTSYGADHKVYLDGSQQSATWSTDIAQDHSRHSGRYLDVGQSIKLPFDTAVTTPGIHTIKIHQGSAQIGRLYGVDLIAQDTSNRNNIQIPSQNVVSYGKKFSIGGSSAATHYDPFNGFTSGNATALAAKIDTETSLGMSNWLSGSTYYRPFNGGRVVKWIASDGTIKTSVTMMPPNAQNINSTASNAHTLGAANDQTINFNTRSIDHSLSEVAKTYHWREFGNGSSNQGTGGTSFAPDYSMHINNDSTTGWLGYTMDDGLTQVTGRDNHTTGNPDNITSGGDGKGFYFTFIGTGITIKTTSAGAGTRTMALNLPYGTHIYKHFRDAGATPDGTIDGVALADIAGNTYSAWLEVTFHQPKMPQVPDDACIIADYMLMADYIAQAAGLVENLPKGTRYQAASRDIYFGGSGTKVLTNNPDAINYRGIHLDVGQHSSNEISLPAFGTRCQASGYNMAADNPQWKVDGSNVTGVTGSGSAGGSSTITPAQTLGHHKFEFGGSGSGGGWNFDGMFIVTPTHTSHHYTNTHESPYLIELVGGDRNMEQHNLIVTPDGKSWDEVTRDTSYIGTSRVRTDHNNVHGNIWNQIFDEWRGRPSAHDRQINRMNKDFAIAYDRMICLKDGTYQIIHSNWSNTNDDLAAIYINGTLAMLGKPSTGGDSVTNTSIVTTTLKRGDYISGGGASGNGSHQWNVHVNFEILEIPKG